MAGRLLRLLPMNMAFLGMIELAILFGLILGMLASEDPAFLLQPANLPRDWFVLAALLAVTIAGTGATIGLYRPEICLDRRRLLISGSIAALLAFPAILLVSGIFSVNLTIIHIAWFVRLLAIWLLLLLLMRFGFSALAARPLVARRVLIVGSDERAVSLHRQLAERWHALFEPVALDPDWQQPAIMSGSSSPCSLFQDFIREQRIWGIVVAGGELPPAMHDQLLDLKMAGIPVTGDRTFLERHLGRIEPEAASSGWLLAPDGFRNGLVFGTVKRMFDVAIALTLAAATLPLMALVAIMVRLDSPGPVLYRQERTGLHGKTFTLLKFRSMTTGAEPAGKPLWAQTRDPRITRVGAFIRASRIDELPQLLNVLRGEMSMIGPRPERPIFVKELARTIPFYRMRETVKPGLTGWAQVNYPYGASVEDAREKLAYDLYYVKNRGFLLDISILAATVRVILFREGAR